MDSVSVGHDGQDGWRYAVLVDSAQSGSTRVGGVVMPKLWLFDIEPHEQRYTSEWKDYLPKQLTMAMANHVWDWTLEVISVPVTSGQTSVGAFLDFAETNIYKAAQITEFVAMIQSGKVNDGDRLLFTDAWHPGVIQCRYMADLMDFNVSIDVMWHAGSYDPWDFLGRKVTNKEWSYAFELALFEAADQNYFATRFHRDLFLNAIQPRHPNKAHVVGWPMEYLPKLIKNQTPQAEKDTILFPHRLSPEKQPEIMEVLEPLLQGFRVVYAQKQALTKKQYHAELARSAVVFSANLQETCGICPYEGLLAGAVPIVPKRLSYSEMYHSLCYPSDWTISVSAAKQHAADLVGHIRKSLSNQNCHALAGFSQLVGNEYFNGGKLYANVLR